MVIVFDKDGNELRIEPEYLPGHLEAGYLLEIVDAEKPKRGRPAKVESSEAE